ncbi:MAG: pyridoxal-phosphate dependent enzyme, partial [Fuerstiella sp.]|nr:pyridoxal-phosphate dependent enzyme [Fuerstiella sp.]
TNAVTVTDQEIQGAMKWLYENHGLRTEPSGVTTVAALLQGRVKLTGSGDVVAVISGRNVDESRFREWISV